jgi:integrase
MNLLQTCRRSARRCALPKLTKSVVDAAARREKQYTVWCSELPGFGVYVQPTGRKTYFVDYRTETGDRRRMTIGRHGVLTTEDARKLALGHLGDATRGGDPQLERRTRRKSLTVSELADQYLEAWGKGLVLGRGGTPKKASTLVADRGRIDRHIKPLLGKRLVVDLVRADVVRFMRDVATGKTATTVKTKLRGKAVVEGGAGTAARTVGLLGGMLSYAISEGIIEANPVAGVQRPAAKVKERRLTAKEYHTLWLVLEDAADVEPWQAIAGIKLLALTGCRRGEIEKLLKTEAKIADHLLALGDTKTGASVRPLAQAAIDVLAGLPASPGPYVLPTTKDAAAPYLGLRNAILRLFKRAGLDDASAHTLRHSFASVGADLGYTDTTIGTVLGHATRHSITSRYIHRLDDVLIAAADAIGAEVLHQMETGKASRLRV